MYIHTVRYMMYIHDVTLVWLGGLESRLAGDMASTAVIPLPLLLLLLMVYCKRCAESLEVKLELKRMRFGTGVKRGGG